MLRTRDLFVFHNCVLSVTVCVPCHFLVGMDGLAVYDCCISCHSYEYEPRYEIYNNVVCATSKGSDQPVHTRSLIRAFASPLNIL